MDSFYYFLTTYADKIPFLALGTGNVSVKLSTQRILEAVIIGVVIAAIGYIAIIPRMEERITLEFAHVRKDISELKHQVEIVEQRRDRDYREITKELRENDH